MLSAAPRDYIPNIVAEVVCDDAGLAAAGLWSDKAARGPYVMPRHKAIYLMVTALDLEQSTVARLTDRHHSTIANACKFVEDQRDDPLFDDEVAELEARLYQKLARFLSARLVAAA